MLESILSMVDDSILNDVGVASVLPILNLLYDQDLDYQVNGNTVTITTDDFVIDVPELITSADITGEAFGNTGYSQKGNPWSKAYHVFLALILRIASAKLTEPGEQCVIRFCRICGRSACPYHGLPDGYVYIKVMTR